MWLMICQLDARSLFNVDIYWQQVGLTLNCKQLERPNTQEGAFWRGPEKLFYEGCVMLVPLKKTVIIVDQMAFRRARVESFLEPWARTENLELISLQPERVHATLMQEGCDILIYDV